MASVRTFRRGRFEPLEQRQMLAGDVLVNVVNGVLTVEGDSADNKIMIAAGAEAGAFVVTGLDGTNVIQEGQSPATEVTVGGVRNVRVGLGEGNDLVAFVSGNLHGNLGIRTGDGDDRVFVGATGDAPELASVVPGEVHVRGSVRIGTGIGADEVIVDATSIGGGLGIDAGADHDIVTVGNNLPDDTSPSVRVRGGVHVDLGAGDNELSLGRLRARGIVALGGEGEDTVDATRVHANVLAVMTAGGADNVSLDQIEARQLRVHTGDGMDDVAVRDSAFAAMNVALGAGNDVLTTAALEARLAVQLGGDGEDTLNVLSENTFGHEIIRGFEIPPDINVNGPSLRPPLARLVRLLR